MRLITWIRIRIFCLILVLVLASSYPAAAAMTREDVITMYKVNPLYLSGRSPVPLDHSVTSIRYEVMVLDGIDRGYVEGATQHVNPFYQFTIVPVDGRAFGDTPRLVVIGYDTFTHGTGGGMVRVWISRTNPPSEESLGRLIEHECDHGIGNPHTTPSGEITAAYTEASRTWGPVTCTRISGSGTTTWKVYL